MRNGTRALVPLLLLCAAAAGPAAEPREFVQAVEFPYYSCPRPLWERELVALKNIGVRSVEFSIPWNWHQTAAAGQEPQFDFTGATNPRRDLAGLVRLLRRLGLRAWVRPLPPVDNWPQNGLPEAATPQDRARWLDALGDLLATQTASHGGPISWVEQTEEGGRMAVDASLPPAHVTRISAADPGALALSRAALTNPDGSLLWTGVVDTVAPAGWEADLNSSFRSGAAGFPGEQHEGGEALRRSVALLRRWAGFVPVLQPVAVPKPAAGRFPDGVSVTELTSASASAVSISNNSAREFREDLRVVEPSTRHTVTITGVSVPPGQALWLPVEVSLSSAGLCRECSNFSRNECVLFATAELLSIEYENGTLGLEFAAPQAASAVLQFARKPVGPYLAAGRPQDFEWDDQTMRARLPIPASSAPGNRVHVVLAIEAPPTAAFFNDAKRLIVGQSNPVSTAYSSGAVAARSRLLLPEGFTAKAVPKSPSEIDYEVAVPADAVSGDTVSFGLETDGVLLGRASLQLFQPVTARLREALAIHFGQHQLTPDPAVVIIDPKAGTNLDLLLMNHWPAIRTYKLDASGDGLDFFPARTEIAVGAMDERHLSLRLFASEGAAPGPALREWRLRITGGADREIPMRAVLLPRGRTVVWSADLDGDGFPEWVLESAHARAIFSPEGGGRWREFTWKDTAVNFLGESGALALPGRAAARAVGDALELTGNGWKRTIRLTDAALTIEQTTPLPSNGPSETRQGTVSLTVEHASDRVAVYTLR